MIGWLDKLNPFKDAADQLTKTFDTWVDETTLDKDKALELKTHVMVLQMEGQRLAAELDAKEIELKAALAAQKETSYQLELKTKTVPWVDSFHKLARTLLAFYSTTINAAVVLIFGYYKIEITANVMAILGLGGVAAGTYIYSKGEGFKVK